ncbi:MAG: HNH endonuclease [Bdellovibrionales bacterium]
MIKLNTKDQWVHNRAVTVSRRIKQSYIEMVEILIDVEDAKIHKKLGQPSTYKYATEILELEESIAYALIAVARKSKEVPALRKAIAEATVSPSKASRMVSTLNNENAVELIEFASCHTSHEIDYEVAKRNPKAAAKDKVKALAEDLFQVTVSFNKQTLECYKRIQSLLAQKGKPCTLSDAIAAAPEYYLEAEDPVRKAERSVKRAEKKSSQAASSQTSPTAPAPNPKTASTPEEEKELCLNRVQKVTIRERMPLTAAQEHAVALRDQGRCTHRNENGRRCNSDRWTATHHIIQVSDGGTNALENLTTLCSFHHDLVHRPNTRREGLDDFHTF